MSLTVLHISTCIVPPYTFDILGALYFACQWLHHYLCPYQILISLWSQHKFLLYGSTFLHVVLHEQIWLQSCTFLLFVQIHSPCQVIYEHNSTFLCIFWTSVSFFSQDNYMIIRNSQCLFSSLVFIITSWLFDIAHCIWIHSTNMSCIIFQFMLFVC